MELTAVGVSQSAYARHRGISQGYVSKLISRGVLLPLEDGRLDVAESDRRLHEHVSPRMRPPAATNAPSVTPAKVGLSLAAEQARKVRIDADRAALRLARERGQFVAVEDVGRAIQKAFHICRNRFLRMPSKLAPQLAGQTATACASIMEGEVYEVLLELSTSLTNHCHMPAAAD